MIFLVLIIAVVNLALGMALALYFDPARGRKIEMIAFQSSPPAGTANMPEQVEAADEPVVENDSPAEDVAEIDEDTAPGEPLEQLDQRKKGACETLLDELQEHIRAYRGLLCDLQGRLRTAGDSIEAADVSKLSADLIAYNAEINGHLEQALDGFEARRDTWDDAGLTLEQLLTELRADRQRATATDEELGMIDPDDDPQTAGQRLRSLLTTCLDRSHELRDRIERVRAEIVFDLGLLDELAPTELLTSHKGVLNRLGIEAKIRTWRQDESNHARPYSLAAVRVDGLAEFNSSLGVLTVDIIIGHVADIMLDAIRPSDSLGQYDGSKFLLFFPDTGPAGATGHVEQMRQTLEAIRFEHQGIPLDVTVSCGMVEGDPDDAIDALTSSAIEAMDAARNEGGNRTLVVEQGEPAQVTPPDYGAESRTIVI